MQRDDIGLEMNHSPMRGLDNKVKQNQLLWYLALPLSVILEAPNSDKGVMTKKSNSELADISRYHNEICSSID